MRIQVHFVTKRDATLNLLGVNVLVKVEEQEVCGGIKGAVTP